MTEVWIRKPVPTYGGEKVYRGQVIELRHQRNDNLLLSNGQFERLRASDREGVATCGCGLKFIDVSYIQPHRNLDPAAHMPIEVDGPQLKGPRVQASMTPGDLLEDESVDPPPVTKIEEDQRATLAPGAKRRGNREVFRLGGGEPQSI